jgi:hypothetical protein
LIFKTTLIEERLDMSDYAKESFFEALLALVGSSSLEDRLTHAVFRNPTISRSYAGQARRNVRRFMGFACHVSFANTSAQTLGKLSRSHFLFLYIVSAAAAAIALPLWFISELGALLRWWFNRE